MINNKKYLFLDFDDTCTYMHGIKEGLSEFIEFCLENFKVYWCSYADYSHIVEELDGSIPADLLNRIIYKKVQSNSKVEFIYNIMGDSIDFVYIDDDICSHDLSLLKSSNLFNNYIQATKNKYDLITIREELEKKIYSFIF